MIILTAGVGYGFLHKVFKNNQFGYGTTTIRSYGGGGGMWAIYDRFDGIFITTATVLQKSADSHSFVIGLVMHLFFFTLQY